MDKMKKSLKIIGIFLTIPLGLLLLYYFFAPIYQFSEPKPFSGGKLFNPYKNMKNSEWLPLNIKSDFPNPSDSETVFIVAKSQKILKPKYANNNFIPAYTHGFNFNDTKQICVGSDEVLWIDLPFLQTTGLKQWIIDRLRPFNMIIALQNQGYTFNDLKKLTNYDLLEINNGNTISVDRWDTALSVGQKAFLLSDNRLGDYDEYSFTMVNCAQNIPVQLIHALKNGIAFGVNMQVEDNTSVENIKKRIKQLPVVEKVSINHDTLALKLSKPVNKIRFIRQKGMEVKAIGQADTAYYIVKHDDQYIRIEITLNNGTVYYLNPIVRYNGDGHDSKLVANIDVSATGWLRLFYFAAVAFLFWYFTHKLPGKNKK